MRSYTNLIEEALKKNRETIDTLQAFQSIIHKVNTIATEYEKEDGINDISIGYPYHGDDYMLITIYLTEKGKIMKDCGSFIDELITFGLEYHGDISIDAADQTKTWYLIHRGISYKYNNEPKNPRVTVKVDASKSKTCIRVPTGEMQPVYELICEEE